MRRLHWMILRQLPGPFLGWLGTLMFLLLMQFLIQHLPDIAGRGLELTVILELITYSLAYMLVLAVPMSVLLATLMVFGRLTETNSYAVIKGAGISLGQLIWPVLVVGLMMMLGMAYFNNVILPESNFRAKNLWQDIRMKKPGFELQPGVFYDGLSGYHILVQDMPEGGNELVDVTIYDYTNGSRRQTIIKADRGLLVSRAGGAVVELELEDGEVHRLQSNRGSNTEDRYERMAFDRHRLRLDLSDFVFERGGLREGYRSDRTTRTADMIRFVDSLRTEIASEKRQLQDTLYTSLTKPLDDLPVAAAQELLPEVRTASDPLPARHLAVAGLSEQEREELYGFAAENIRSMRSEIDDTQRSISWKEQRINRYRVEIYKKYSIAVACFIFVLVGAPLGLSIGRGGLGTVGALALGIFLFYWISLVQGEKLSDRGIIDPWVGMWIANIVIALAALWLIVYVVLDLRATPPLRTRLRQWLSERLGR